jgi:tetratricopeptide (TPR) repeat protein
LRRRRLLAAALLCAATLGAYALAPLNGFVWDDHKVIEKGRLVGSLANLPALFTHDAMYNSDGGAFQRRATVDTYRPLTMSTFLVEHALFGKRPAGYHVMSVLYHLAAVLALWAVGLALGLGEGAALLGALLFAVHPSLSEAVHWVNGRSDPLSVACFLGATLAWLRGRGAAAAILFLLATLCKETAFLLALPLVLLVGLRAERLGRPAPRGWRGLVVLWPFAAGGALGLALRLVALGRPAVSAGGGHAGHALARLPALWVDGLRALVVPAAEMPPSLYERYREVPLYWTALALLLIAALAGIAILLHRNKKPLFAAALAAFLLVLAPVAQLTAEEGWFGWGRYLYPAAALLLLGAGQLLIEGTRGRLRPPLRRLVLTGAGLFVAAAALVTFLAGPSWRDDRSFAMAIVMDHPGYSMGYSEAAVVEMHDRNPGFALVLLDRAIALRPDYARHHSRRANALMQLERRREAYAAAARALALDPADNNGRYVTALLHLETRREAEAARLLLDVLAAEPEQEGPWRTVAQALTHLGPASPFAEALRAGLGDPRYVVIAARLGDLMRRP